MRFSEFEDWLATLGWQLDRIKGSHFHYKHPATGQRITVSQHGRQVEREQFCRVVRDLERMPVPPVRRAS